MLCPGHQQGRARVPPGGFPWAKWVGEGGGGGGGGSGKWWWHLEGTDAFARLGLGPIIWGVMGNTTASSSSFPCFFPQPHGAGDQPRISPSGVLQLPHPQEENREFFCLQEAQIQPGLAVREGAGGQHGSSQEPAVDAQ